jgi:hypothetical protein
MEKSGEVVVSELDLAIVPHGIMANPGLALSKQAVPVLSSVQVGNGGFLGQVDTKRQQSAR